MVARKKPQIVDIAVLNREHTQLRAVMDDAAVESYAEQYNTRKNGSGRMPPVAVYESKSGELFLVDGFHRVAAKERLRQKTIPAIIEPGELDDAIIAAAKVNRSHNAVRWTNADKRNAAEVLVRRFPNLPTRELGDLAGCSHKLIGNVKKELKGEREAPKKGRVLKKPTRNSVQANLPERTGQARDKAAEQTDAEITASIIDLMRRHLSDEHSTDEEIVTCWCRQYGQGGAA